MSCLILASCHINNDKLHTQYGVALDTMLFNARISNQFENCAPDFKIEKRKFDFLGPNGSDSDSLWIIMDRDRCVALYQDGEKPFLDVFANNPYEAPDTLIMPVRYHNATLLGTRLTTSNWYDKWAISGDEHTYAFSEGGDSLTLTETQRWHKSGAYKRDAISSHTFTFKCDPKLGYVVDMQFLLETDDSTNLNPEFINFMPRDVVNPWPGESRYHHTIYTPASREGYFGYANNLYAGNISDEEKTDWGKGFEVSRGGFIAMVEPNTWSPALFRYGNYRFMHRTCDAWLDQHNHIILPPKNPDGFFRINARFLFVQLPPEASNYILDHAQIDHFDNKKAVMIQLGTTETFEDQPLALTTELIGLTKGFWQEDFQISREFAYSGIQSMVVKGLSKKEVQKPQANFIRYPQVPLKPNASYQLSAWVKVEGHDMEAYISGSLYEWTPYDTTRIERHASNVSTSAEWVRLSMMIKTPAYDPFIDLRFVAVGSGKAYFDDFEFIQLTGK